MKILINKDGQIIGPLSEEETIRRFDRGEFSETDLAMVEGATGWHELGSYIVEEPIPLEAAPAGERATSRLVSQSCEVPSSDEPMSSLTVTTPHKSAGIRRRTIAAVSAFLVLVTVLWVGWSHFMTRVRVPAEEPKEQSAAAMAAPSPTEVPPPLEQMGSEIKTPPEALSAEDSIAKSNSSAAEMDSAISDPVAPPQGPRVLLQRDTMLLFRNEPYRKAEAGEEFQVLANRADTGRVYVKETDAAGNVIALSLPAELVTPVAGSAVESPALVQQMPAPAAALPGQVSNTEEPPRQASRPSMSMDVKTIASGGRVRSRNGAVVSQGWDYANNRQLKSEQYWSTRDRESRVGLSIQVQNFSQSAQEVRIETFFTGTPVTGPRTPFLVSKNIENHTVGGGDRLLVEAFSDVARSSTRRDFSTRTNPNSYGVSDRLWSANDTTSGTKVSGWIVRLVAAERVVQVRASSPTLEQMAKSPAGLDQLAGQLRPVQPQ